jgi:hypothetical protein
MQYFMLGSSLATILEIPGQADCLKALQVVVQEYDYFIASESKSKMVPYILAEKYPPSPAGSTRSNVIDNHTLHTSLFPFACVEFILGNG